MAGRGGVEMHKGDGAGYGVIGGAGESSRSRSRSFISSSSKASHRIDVIGRHLLSSPPLLPDLLLLRPAHTSSSSASASASSPSAASSSDSSLSPNLRRNQSSYQRIHGDVLSNPVSWQPCRLPGPDLQDLLYEKAVNEGIVKITINRPERRNAFRPQTVAELLRAFCHARDDTEVGVIILTGKGTEAFCSGGDQAVRGKHGYVGTDNIGRLNILDVQVQIRRLPKPVIAMVAGYCVGGGHVLHMVCDLTIAADNAVFGQTGPKVGSFDAGYGSSIMSRLVGPKKAREMWFLARFYTAEEALNMGLINTVVPVSKLEEETVQWCREILRNSPTAVRILKSALNAVDDGHAGLQELSGNATLLFYNSEEAAEGKNAFLERRQPDFTKFPRLP